jgi:hypothetical protein
VREKWAEQEPMECHWTACSNRRRCSEYGSCVAKAQAGGATFPQEADRSPDYQRGWDDCYAAVQKALGERFTTPVHETR